ncbi:hypothetical protein [Paenibacillus wynnii]|uniref:hypothetical protein n=1 Tax=Paenibacillus wynnii TaxID=268407 RepID=UPI00278F2FC4|nr:hypothetical protein [Paenibacillus wynnii]MDQ0196435.1 hypothetical protein [Paenibacillus wynnii]
MKVKKIEYPTALSKIVDIHDNNMDVFIELEDGTHITVVVSTPLNLPKRILSKRLKIMLRGTHSG